MKLLTSFLYLLKRRRSGRADFDRLYRLSADPLGVESYPYEQRKIARVLQCLEGKRFHHVLDIGCGTGTLARRIAAHADSVTAIDFSSRAIARAKQYTNPPNIRFYCADLVAFVFEQYDLVICSEVLYYLPANDLLHFIEIVKKQQDCLLMSIGKIAEPIDTVLAHHFELTDRIEEKENRRPYAINSYRVKRQ